MMNRLLQTAALYLPTVLLFIPLCVSKKPNDTCVSLCYLCGKIDGFRVAGGDGGVIPQQQIMHGCAHNLTAPNHDRSLPCHRNACREAS